MTPAQCRAARAYLGWSREQLAKTAGTAASPIDRYEGEEEDYRPAHQTVEKIKAAFAAAGLLLPREGGVLLMLKQKGD